MEAPRRAALTVFSLSIALSILAATGPSAVAGAEEEITPSTAVARLKIAKGTAWVRPADSGEWEEYSHNSPMVERSRVSIPDDSESEIQFRGSQFLLLTGWAGPWGVSFASNLTPDKETGIGTWTEETFLRILRTGTTPGGRPILPPMPWEAFRKVNDRDMKAIYAYLKSLPPIPNMVPAQVPPK